jgi:hypothetical protein
MRRLLGLLTGTCVFVLMGSFAWTHRPQVQLPAAALPPTATQPVETLSEYSEETQAREMVTITGPLAEYMSHQSPAKAEIVRGTSQSATAAPNAADRVGDSPVGTSHAILHKIFTVAKAANLPFEIPPHAVNAQLRGTYRSFLPAGAKSEDEADVEFLLLNQQQYSALLNQRPVDAMFSAEGSHDQEVNFSMPPTLDQPVKYYLVFRNGATTAGKIAVQADFRVDF